MNNGYVGYNSVRIFIIKREVWQEIKWVLHLSVFIPDTVMVPFWSMTFSLAGTEFNLI